jgi:hypothetical protein
LDVALNGLVGFSEVINHSVNTTKTANPVTPNDGHWVIELCALCSFVVLSFVFALAARMIYAMLERMQFCVAKHDGKD